MFKGLNAITFSEKFATDDDCRKYLSLLKWKKGYRCCKCGHDEYYEVKKAGSRLCTKCKYAESATAGTLFHKVKFPLRKAFYVAFIMTTSRKGISSYELSRRLGLRQKTCWAFKQKVFEAMKSHGKELIKSNPKLPEFYIGGAHTGNPTQGKDIQKSALLAIQNY